MAEQWGTQIKHNGPGVPLPCFNLTGLYCAFTHSFLKGSCGFPVANTNLFKNAFRGPIIAISFHNL